LHPDRVQVLGNSEVSYLATLEPRRARETVAAVATAGAACFVVTNDVAPPAVLTEAAEAAGVAALGSALRTADFIRSATAWLEDRMAPETTLHGDLVEMHGLGILILGKSGIGKSEAALDLVARGHRLIADDVVQVRRPSPTGVRGRSARLLGHHMEIRGLGVIDVEALFGTLATLDERQIDLVVELVEWPGGADRLGLVAGSSARRARARQPQERGEAERESARAGRRGLGRAAGAARGLVRRARSARALDGPPASYDRGSPPRGRDRALRLGQEHRHQGARGPGLLLHRQPAGGAHPPLRRGVGELERGGAARGARPRRARAALPRRIPAHLRGA